MDFFAHQDDARKKTRQLVTLFALAVASLVAITNVLVAVTYLYVLRGGKVVAHHYSAQDLDASLGWQTYLSVSAIVVSIIFGAIAFKWLALSGGGKTVAESMGGRLVQPNATNTLERRLINVVEEMAIASGMPVPPVYLLDEKGINAFAAGSTPADAVIGITQGALDNLNREQLQGVVAHEFSHILNGDMRLNTRLVAVLFGIVFIGLAGRALLSDDHRGYGRRSHGRQYQVAMLGAGLVSVGWLGSFFGNCIKAAVSRQREFLADASAVQFTRNPEGFANALRIIGGNTARGSVQANGAEQYSHMFFNDALLRGSALLATHPKLEQRIRRIKPDWDGSYIYESQARHASASAVHDGVQHTANSADIESVINFAVDTGTNMQAAKFSSDQAPAHDAIAAAHTLFNDIPSSLNQQCHEPLGAVAVLCGLLLSKEAAVRERQLVHLDLCAMAGLRDLTNQISGDITHLSSALRLPLLELCLPTLKQMSTDQYKRLKRVMLLLIRTDGQLDLAEWCVFQVVCHYVEPALGLSKLSAPRYRKIDDVASECQLVLSMLAWFGHAEATREVVENAFQRGAAAIGLQYLSLVDAKACRIDDFSKAVNRLANCYPLLKPQVLKAVVACARYDNVVSVPEREVIHAIAAVMDCPMPLVEQGA